MYYCALSREYRHHSTGNNNGDNNYYLLDRNYGEYIEHTVITGNTLRDYRGIINLNTWANYILAKSRQREGLDSLGS